MERSPLRWLLPAVALWLAVSVQAQNPNIFSDELGVPRYDCIVLLKPAVNVSADSRVTLALEIGSGADATQIQITRDQLVILSLANKKETRLAPVPSGVTPGTPYQLTILRRANWLGVLHDDKFLFRGQVPMAPGAQAGTIAGTGWAVTDARIQRLEPVAFADNFMRTADEKGAWVVQEGQWALQSAWDRDPKGNAKRFQQAIYAMNPFAWVGRSTTGSALCTTGKPYWEDYTLSTAVRPGMDGAVGVMVNMPDTRSGLLVRWSPANDRSPQGDHLTLYRVTDGKREQVAEDAGGYVPGQWYQLQVTSSVDGIHVLVDGRKRLSAKEITPWRGGIGLYAEGNGGIFDDTTVYGSTLKKDLIAENELSRLNLRFLEDPNGMGKWANPRSDWRPTANTTGQWAHRFNFFGDHWITLTVKPTAEKSGKLWLAVNTDGVSVTSGYRAVVLVEAEQPQVKYALYRGTEVIAQATGDRLSSKEDYHFRLLHVGNRIRLERDDEKVVEATDAEPLTGACPIYGAAGCFSSVRETMALGRNMHDYVFADSPVDWIGHGAWMPTVRWACSPEWSFLGGWSTGEAILWNKARFTGDQVFQAFIGLLMEYPHERDTYHERYRDAAITICGDGIDPRSGYAGIYGAPDEKGKPNQRTVLLRNGVIVASANVTIPGFDPQTHRNWYDLVLYKRGDTVEFWVEGVKRLSFTDPAPLDGGIPAIWSEDNGIAVSRARMSCANPPKPRTDPQVILDEPDYPEWVDVGKPLVLDFAKSWSTAGKAIKLEEMPEQRPEGSKAQPVVDGTRVTFAPDVRGWYWYRIHATDGDHRSPDFHLLAPAFTPAVGRDDSHALVLYRFAEGSGKVTKDQSKVAPAVNLAVPKDAQWLPGQGVSMIKATMPIMSVQAAAKLKPLITKRAFTVEMWVSNSSVYPINGRASLLSWDSGWGEWNFAIGHCDKFLMAIPSGEEFLGNARSWADVGDHVRTGLQHLVVAWDGRTITGYINGKKEMTKQNYFYPETWKPDNLLLLGMRVDGTNKYLGAYYLVAIHDACFTADQVQRHYQAGPGAK
ncbi:MAG: LamG-like jellyroll fold domain-containing protein [Armatimonadota bacterium]